MPLLYGFGDGPASTQAAWRKSSIWLSQLAIWFQLPGVGDEGRTTRIRIRFCSA